MKPAGIFVLLVLGGYLFSFGQTTSQLIDSARFYKNSDYSKVIFFAALAHRRAIAGKQHALIAESAFRLGMGNYLAGNYNETLKSYFEAEKEYSAIKDTAGLAELFTEMCVFYVKIKKFNEADDVSKKAVSYSLSIKDIKKLAPAINNRGLMFLDEGKIDNAINAFRSSYNLYTKLKNKTGMAYSLDYLSSALSEKGSYRQALQVMNESKQLRIGIGDKTGEAIAINNIGELFLKEKKPGEAAPYFRETIKRAHELKYPDLEIYAYNMLSQTLKQLRNYPEAYKAQSKYIELNQKFQDVKRNKAIEELQTRYETNKKEQQNKLLTEQNMAQQIKLSRNRIGIYALFAITVLSTILFYLLYTKTKLRQHARFKEAMAEEEKLRVEGIMDAEENERQRLARELHDGVGQLLSAARRKIQLMQTNIVEERDVPLQMLDDSIKEVRDLSHSMMPPYILNKSLVQAIEEFISRTNHEQRITIHTEWVNTNELDLDKTTTLMLYRSVQEIITNAFRHARSTSIHVELVNHYDEMILMIYDNGVGFDKEKLLQRGTGLGLKNIQSRIAYIGGSLQIDTTPGKGVTYIIELPLLNKV